MGREEDSFLTSLGQLFCNRYRQLKQKDGTPSLQGASNFLVQKKTRGTRKSYMVLGERSSELHRSHSLNSRSRAGKNFTQCMVQPTHFTATRHADLALREAFREKEGVLIRP